MDKNRFVRLYLWLSIVFVGLMMILMGLFLSSFPVDAPGFSDLNGNLETTIFNLRFYNAFQDVSITNNPLIVAITFFVITVLVAVYSYREKKLENKLLSEILVYNSIIALMIIVSSIVFMMLIPDKVNGLVEHGIYMTKMYVQTDEYVSVFNFGYILMMIYIVLNFAALYATKEKKFAKKVEENNEEGREFLR